jgi:hypothetical protein
MTATSRFADLVNSSAAHLAELVAGRYNMLTEIEQLRADVEAYACKLENSYGMPVLDWLDVTTGAPTAAGGDVLIYGRNLLQSQTFDSLVLTCGAGVVTLHALTPGVSGITVVVAAPSGSLAVTYSTTTKICTITPAAAGSTDDAVATAINTAAAQTDGHIRAISSTLGTFLSAVASQPMTGGAGDYAQNILRVAGTQCYPANTQHATVCAAKWTDTSIIATFPNLTALTPALAATDKVAFSLMSNGKIAVFPGLILA